MTTILKGTDLPERWALTNATLILPDRMIENGWIEIASGRIQRVGKIPRRVAKSLHVIDVQGNYVAPGFIDIHVHGAAGADFMDGTPGAVAKAARCHLQHGTTTLFPTTTTGTYERILAMIEAVATARSDTDAPLPSMPGIHLYGPYFAPEKAGCHQKAECRVPRSEEFKQYFATGLVRIATCAAELEGSLEFYRYAKKRNCLVTCGHSDASWTEMALAHRAGMTHVDHFWCAMSSVASVRNRLGTPMQGSMLEFVLGHPTMSTEVIADGCHLAPELLQFAWQMKGPDNLCLVTDANRAMDMPPGRYAFGHAADEVWFESDGQVGRALSGGLASGIRGLDHAIRHMATKTRVPLVDIVRMATLTPARLTGIDADRGSLTVGKRADLVVMTKRLAIRTVYFGTH